MNCWGLLENVSRHYDTFTNSFTAKRYNTVLFVAKMQPKNEKFALPADAAVYPALAEAKILVSLGKYF